MNNKGFATSFILFSLLVLFLVVMGVMIFTLNNSSKLNNKIKTDLINQMEETFEGDSRRMKAVDIYYDNTDVMSGETSNNNSRTGLDCSDLQCALDKIQAMIK